MPEEPAPARLTRAERRAETRRRLLDAAATVFVRRGLGGASVEEIAAEAGFTRGAFYSNFDNKEEMFVELLQERVYAGYREMLERVPQDASPIERLRWGANELMERYLREEDVWLFALWLELLAYAARHPEFRLLAATFWRGNRAALAQGIEEADKPLPLEPRQVATAMIALDIGLAVQNLVDPEEAPLDLYPPLYEQLFGRLIEEPKEPE